MVEVQTLAACACFGLFCVLSCSQAFLVVILKGCTLSEFVSDSNAVLSNRRKHPNGTTPLQRVILDPDQFANRAAIWNDGRGPTTEIVDGFLR